MGANFLSSILGTGVGAGSTTGTLGQGFGQALKTWATGARAPENATHWQKVGERLGDLVASPGTFLGSRLGDILTPTRHPPNVPPKRPQRAYDNRRRQGPGFWMGDIGEE